jgi:hypothetical protein
MGVHVAAPPPTHTCVRLRAPTICIHDACMYLHDACMYLHPCASGYTDERIAGAGPPHTRAHVLRPCARARVGVRLGAHASAPTPASAFRRRGPRVVRLAGVPRGAGVQREHRRVEHRVCVEHAVGMRRFTWPCDGVQRQHRRVGHRACHRLVLGMRRLSGPGGAPLRRDALGRVFDAARAVVRNGTAGARACVCADVWACACAGVPVRRYSCAYERRVICMYGYSRVDRGWLGS